MKNSVKAKLAAATIGLSAMIGGANTAGAQNYLENHDIQPAAHTMETNGEAHIVQYSNGGDVKGTLTIKLPADTSCQQAFNVVVQEEASDSIHKNVYLLTCFDGNGDIRTADWYQPEQGKNLVWAKPSAPVSAKPVSRP